MTKKEYRDRMIEIEEESTSLLKDALYPMGASSLSVFAEMVNQLEGINKKLYKIIDALERISDEQ